MNEFALLCEAADRVNTQARVDVNTQIEDASSLEYGGESSISDGLSANDKVNEVLDAHTANQEKSCALFQRYVMDAKKPDKKRRESHYANAKIMESVLVMAMQIDGLREMEYLFKQIKHNASNEAIIDDSRYNDVPYTSGLAFLPLPQIAEAFLIARP